MKDKHELKRVVSELLINVRPVIDELVLREMPFSRPLSELEKSWAFDSGVMQPDAIRLRELVSISKPDQVNLKNFFRLVGIQEGETAGLTLGNLVLISQSHYSERLLRHEFRHVYQWNTFDTTDAFLSEYFTQIATHGYWNAPLEVDARNFELLSMADKISKFL